MRTQKKLPLSHSASLPPVDYPESDRHRRREALEPFVPQESQYDLLPVEYRELCDPFGALPLEYLDAGWLMWCLTSMSPYTSIPVSGRGLHREWETPGWVRLESHQLHRVHAGWLPVRCPDDRYLLVKVTVAEYLPRARGVKRVSPARR